MGSLSLDAVDREILYQLQSNARQPITEIADAADVSDNTVRNRIERLEDAGVIEGYQANVDYDEADVPHYYIFVCSARVSERDELAEEVRGIDGIVEVITLMTGNSNVLLLAAVGKKGEISDLAFDIDGLGLDIEREHLVRNHVHQPLSRFHVPDDV